MLLATLQAEVVELEPIEVNGSSFNYREPSILTPIKELESQVVIQETVPGFKNPVINGLMGDKILLTVDGIKFSNSLFRSGPNQYYSWIPDEFITKAQLNSKLGEITSSALGGSINRDLSIDESSIGISYRTASKGHKEVIKYKDDKYEVGLLNQRTSNVDTPDGEVQHSSYNQKGFYLANKSKTYGITKIVFTQSNDIDRTDKFEKGDYYVYELQQYLLISHKYYIPDTYIMFIPSFQQFKEKIDRDDPATKNVDSTNNIFGMQLVGYYEADWTGDGYFSYGLVDNFEDIDYKTGINKNTYNYNTFSAYSTYHSRYGKIDYDLKYKYSLMTAKGSGLDRTLDNHAVGINTKYRLGQAHNIFVSADLNYKFPTITNLAEARDDSVTEIANPNLEQEKAYTMTLGYKNGGFTTSIFYKKLYNMIIRVETNIPDGNGGFKWQYQNTDEGYIKGINLKYSKIFENGWGIYSFAEYLDGKTDYDYISKLVPFHAETRISYKPYFIEYLYASKVDDDKQAEKDKQDIRIKNHNEGYSIFNIGYEQTFKNVHKVSIILENVLNETGRVYGSSVDFGARGIYINYTYKY